MAASGGIQAVASCLYRDVGGRSIALVAAGDLVAAGLGAKVAIIENRFFGGTCVNVGCVPKKLFSYGAAFPDLFHLAADLLLHVTRRQPSGAFVGIGQVLPDPFNRAGQQAFNAQGIRGGQYTVVVHLNLLWPKPVGGQ